MLKIFKYIFIYTILIISFIGLLTLSSSFSSNKIYHNVKESSKILLKEDNRKLIYIPYKNEIMQFDNYSDALMINTIYSIDSKTPLYSSFVARKNYIPNKTIKIYEEMKGELKSSSKYEVHNEVGELNDLVNGEIWESFEYARYWHGYLVILRPLLILFNLKTIRILLTILLIVLALILLYLIRKKINTITAIIFFIGLIFSEYFYLCFSLHGVFNFLIMMISSIILLIKFKKIKDFGILFFIIGILTNFFDLLTVPIITLGVPLIIYSILFQKENDNNKELLLNIIKLSIIWGIGYAITWLTKWILTDFIFNKNLIKTSLEQVTYRISLKEINFFTPLLINIGYMFSGFSTMLFTIVFYIKFQKKSNNSSLKKDSFMNTLPYIIIGCFPIIWYIVLKNHSYEHSFFTYRNLILTNICLGLIIKQIFEKSFIKN